MAWVHMLSDSQDQLVALVLDVAEVTRLVVLAKSVLAATDCSFRDLERLTGKLLWPSSLFRCFRPSLAPLYSDQHAFTPVLTAVSPDLRQRLCECVDANLVLTRSVGIAAPTVQLMLAHRKKDRFLRMQPAMMVPCTDSPRRTGLRRQPRTGIKAVFLAMIAIALAPFGHERGAFSFVASPTMVSRVGSRSHHLQQLFQSKAAEQEEFDDLHVDDGAEGDEDFFDQDEGEEEALAELEDPESHGDAPLSQAQTKADVARQRLWNMPKDVAPYLQVANAAGSTKGRSCMSIPNFVRLQVTYQNKEKLARTRNLVVLKAKNSQVPRAANSDLVCTDKDVDVSASHYMSQAMLQKSEKIIKQGTLSKIRMRRLMRHGRGEFGRDNALQWNRPGRRAFRMRSGMKDLRYADPLERSQRRKKDIRPPDWKNKRTRPGQGQHQKRWIGSSHRYGRGTTISKRRANGLTLAQPSCPCACRSAR
ncbi:unnamed protein product [Symbiodinium necroappetens]|uniref:Uncharacterized protein n=1 Tax=Symbiodinium necroappetens TaxID=1628268 RepID=A0A812X5I6_9DINO|nr:unnamed protein product [Symbiodinium necroappetens]